MKADTFGNTFTEPFHNFPKVHQVRSQGGSAKNPNFTQTCMAAKEVCPGKTSNPCASWRPTLDRVRPLAMRAALPSGHEAHCSGILSQRWGQSPHTPTTVFASSTTPLRDQFFMNLDRRFDVLGRFFAPKWVQCVCLVPLRT